MNSALLPTPAVVMDSQSGSLIDRCFAVLALSKDLTQTTDATWPTLASCPQPADAMIMSHHRGDDAGTGIVALHGGLVSYSLFQQSVTVMAAAAHPDALPRLMDAATEMFPRWEPPPPDSSKVVLGLWWTAPHGPQWRQQYIAAPPWRQIQRNYPAETAAHLTALTDDDRIWERGRLIVLHGPPGTGKTSFLRSLAGAWRSWCRFDYVVDPEKMLGSAPDYLLNVLALGNNNREDRWRALILEDTGALLRPDAADRTGQGLSRLLNSLDGLLGQGSQTMMVITTNEPLGELHPAVVRPGRCAARIELPAFSSAEAAVWRKAHKVVSATGEATLAELYAEAAGQAVTKKRDAVGFR